VPDGLEAVEAAARTNYALIFMDCRMPRLDGLEATRQIRRAESDGHRTPIIALTADVMNEDRARCLAAGMDGHVAKPVDMTGILSEICRQVGGGGARGAGHN
jgi:CheY-like chemotaxis protein